MCERCVEIDKEIDRYRRLHNATTDTLAMRRLKEVIDKLTADKISFHASPVPDPK